MMCGGFTDANPANPEVQEVLNSVKAELEGRISRPISVLEAVAYKTQVVAGVNYLVKANVDGTIVHVKIAKPLPHTGKPNFILSSVHEGLTQESSLEII